MAEDYRTSHLGRDKAQSYHRKFSDNPFRAYVWSEERRHLDEMLRSVVDKATTRHLDFACGSGRLLEFFAGKVAVSVGIDVSEDMLEIASAVEGVDRLVCADLTRSNALEGEIFDLITAFRFFPNAQMELRVSALNAIVNHLVEDGVLVFNNHKNSSSLLYKVASMLPIRKRAGMSSEEVKELVSNAGLEVFAIRQIGVLPASDGVRVLPMQLYRWLDRLLANAFREKEVGVDVLYFCRRRTAGIPGRAA